MNPRLRKIWGDIKDSPLRAFFRLHGDPHWCSGSLDVLWGTGHSYAGDRS